MCSLGKDGKAAQDAADLSIAGAVDEVENSVAGMKRFAGSGPCDAEAGELNVLVL
jgi:hypothetical protein